MWKFLILFCSFSSLIFSQEDQVYLCLDALNLQVVNTLERMRSTKSEYIDQLPPGINRTGLASLNASGSAQFSFEGLNKLKKLILNKDVVVIDLRKESHGFANTMPISWIKMPQNSVNAGKSNKEIIQDENRLLTSLLHQKNIQVWLYWPLHHRIIGKFIVSKINSVDTEINLVERSGWNYLRFFVEDHNKPSDEIVDQFIENIKQRNALQWLHFHCRDGYSRTTCFLAMLDMMMNAKNVSLKDIAERQYHLGGANILNFGKNIHVYSDAADYKNALLLKSFIVEFYDYCKTNNDGYKTLWSEYQRNFKMEVMNGSARN